MPFSNRDPAAMKKAVDVKNGKMTAKDDIVIYVPMRYKVYDMLTFGNTIDVGGPYYISNGKAWALSVIPGTFSFSPETIYNTTIDNQEFLALTFSKGSVILERMEVLKIASPMFGMLIENILRGNPPSLMSVSDIERAMVLGAKYSSGKFGGMEKAIEIFMSIISRQKDDPKKFARADITKPSIIKGLSNMTFGYNNETSATSHNYFLKGVTKVLADKELPVTELDKIISGK